jgi:hypothetical protein
MEAVVAVGLAGNVVQFISFAGTLIAETKSLHDIGSPRSLPGILDRINDLTRQAEIIHDRLRASHGPTPVPTEDKVSHAHSEVPESKAEAFVAPHLCRCYMPASRKGVCCLPENIHTTAELLQ